MRRYLNYPYKKPQMLLNIEYLIPITSRNMHYGDARYIIGRHAHILVCIKEYFYHHFIIKYPKSPNETLLVFKTTQVYPFQSK